MRYAVGVGGIGAVISLMIVGLSLSPITAVIGGLIVLAFMILLFAFSSKAQFKRLTAFMAWSFSLMAFACTLLLGACFFFDTPKSVPCLLANHCVPSVHASDGSAPPNPTAPITPITGSASAPPDGHAPGAPSGGIANPTITNARDVHISYGDVNGNMVPVRPDLPDAGVDSKH